MRKGKNQQDKQNKKGISLILSIVLVFFMLGAVVFSVARKITVEMSTENDCPGTHHDGGSGKFHPFL